MPKVYKADEETGLRMIDVRSIDAKPDFWGARMSHYDQAAKEANEKLLSGDDSDLRRLMNPKPIVISSTILPAIEHFKHEEKK